MASKPPDADERGDNVSSAAQPQGNDRDANVVEEICGYITRIPARSFFLFAGAGSGKTRTLVEVLRRITGVVPHNHGGQYALRLRTRGQSVRVITYTKNATAVVNGRLGENYLTAVSTIHSFCWELIAGFDDDIREACIAIERAELEEAIQEAKNKAKGVSTRDKEKFAEREATIEEIASTARFIYHPDRNTYGQGALQHTQVLHVTAWLIKHRPTLQRIVEDRHPLILIDESQDTMKSVLDALFELANSRPGRITLGLIGDHRQRIYGHGYDDLPSQVPAEWAKPALQMNHRSQRRIVDLINKIWDADVEGRTQPKTGVAQHPREEKTGGTVRIFVGDTKLSPEEKLVKEAACAQLMAGLTASPAWLLASRSYKVLALEHKLAARRGGFYDAYVAMDLLDKDAAAPQGNGENTGPAVARMLLGPLIELAHCVRDDASVDEFASMNALRRNGMLERLPDETGERRTALENMHHAVADFARMCSKEGSTVREVLATIVNANLLEYDAPLIRAYLDNSEPPAAPKNKSSEPKEDRRKRGWHALFVCKWSEVERYQSYLSGGADLATHQVVKGSEFKHVMVVMDDEDAGGFLISYDKLFGGAQLSVTDLSNAADSKETTIDRTLRLFYVTCSRAEESLALVLWAKDPTTAQQRIQECGWFEPDEIIPMERLSN